MQFPPLGYSIVPVRHIWTSSIYIYSYTLLRLLKCRCEHRPVWYTDIHFIYAQCPRMRNYVHNGVYIVQPQDVLRGAECGVDDVIVGPSGLFAHSKACAKVSLVRRQSAE